MKTALLLVAFCTVVVACREEFHPLPPPTDPPLSGIKSTCQPPAIEKNIVGTWHFETNRIPGQVTRTGTVTFTAQNHIIDPDSLFQTRMDLGVFVDKMYTTDGTYVMDFPGYTGKIFRIDLLLKDNRVGIMWPLYVASNDCNRIVIYQLASYNEPVAEKIGFILTR